MHNPPHEVRGARGTLGKLLASNDPKIIPASRKSKPRPLTADPPSPWRALGPVVNVVVDDLHLRLVEARS